MRAFFSQWWHYNLLMHDIVPVWTSESDSRVGIVYLCECGKRWEA